MSVREGQGGTFFVSTNIRPETDIVIAFSTSDGSATAGDDYTAISGQVTILANTLGVNLPVQLVALTDGGLEGAETLNINLDSIVSGNAILADPLGVATITDLTLSIIGDVTVLEGETAQFTVQSSHAVAEDITFTFSTADVTTVSPDDFTAFTGSATISAGQRTVRIDIRSIDDIAPENTDS